jgi:nucleotide-binding universal stress UspA family protein
VGSGLGGRPAAPRRAIGHDGEVYENVIVPFEGSLEGRVVLGPASDLAWRAGARMVVVSNTDASDKSSKAAVKLQAIAKSGADVEFWIDLDHPLADAALKAIAYRKDPLVCVASPRPVGGLRRRRKGLGQLVLDVTNRCTVPVMVVGPVADVARGLAMTEALVVLDCTPSSEELLAFAVSWCKDFKLRMVVTAAPAPGTNFTPPDLQQYLDQRVDRLESPGGVSTALIQGDDEADGLIELAAGHEDAVVIMSSNHGKAGGLGSFATKVVSSAMRPVIVRPG